ncbi:hypothetical protein PR048_025473 [Dryococelus australis]|uniref:Uncharacterized protein n=1 Tax=Dryococelus australis TaxID=614101 RepID=A0ABQ9GRD4_9NEOP|nr:hypothetical protein PR048_025473 [Dryococelus australis]
MFSSRVPALEDHTMYTASPTSSGPSKQQRVDQHSSRLSIINPTAKSTRASSPTRRKTHVPHYYCLCLGDVSGVAKSCRLKRENAHDRKYKTAVHSRFMPIMLQQLRLEARGSKGSTAILDSGTSCCHYGHATAMYWMPYRHPVHRPLDSQYYIFVTDDFMYGRRQQIYGQRKDEARHLHSSCAFLHAHVQSGSDLSQTCRCWSLKIFAILALHIDDFNFVFAQCFARRHIGFVITAWEITHALSTRVNRRYFGCWSDLEYRYTFSNRRPFSYSSRLSRTHVLPQPDGSVKILPIDVAGGIGDITCWLPIDEPMQISVCAFIISPCITLHMVTRNASWHEKVFSYRPFSHDDEHFDHRQVLRRALAARPVVAPQCVDLRPESQSPAEELLVGDAPVFVGAQLPHQLLQRVLQVQLAAYCQQVLAAKEIGRQIRPAATTEDLEGHFHQLWQDLPEESIRRLYASKPNRIATCLHDTDGPTPYTKCTLQFRTGAFSTMGKDTEGTGNEAGYIELWGRIQRELEMRQDILNLQEAAWKQPQDKKSNGEGSGERVGNGTGPPIPIHLRGYSAVAPRPFPSQYPYTNTKSAYSAHLETTWTVCNPDLRFNEEHFHFEWGGSPGRGNTLRVTGFPARSRRCQSSPDMT